MTAARHPLTYLALAAGLLSTGVVRPASAQTGYPMITSVYPVGCRRGTTTEITIYGAMNLAGAYGVMFEKPGMTAEIIHPNPAPASTGEVKLKITAAADVPLGTQEIRIVTPRGISSVGLLVVGAEPEMVETEPNPDVDKTELTFPITVNGRIQQGEDVDTFKFNANAGDEVVFACISARLQDRIHDLSPGGGGEHSDPILVITDDKGRELATGDDYWGPDPLLTYHFPKAGSYRLQVRDVRFKGMGGWTYRVVCTKSPYLLGVYPMAGQKGQSMAVQPVGFNLGGMKESTVAVPAMDLGPSRGKAMDLALKVGAESTNAVPFMVTDVPQTLETADNNTPEKGTPSVAPGGFNGRIEAPNDIDYFKFKGVKGKLYNFEVFSRRYGTSLDSFIQVTDLKGGILANNDDGTGKDSYLAWTCPDDVEYCLQITDLHSRGGPDFVYYVAALDGLPDFVLYSDDDKALIGPGSGYAMYLRAERRNGFNGDIKVSVEGLPPGVTATADRIPANMTQGCVILSAAADAKINYSRIRMYGTATAKMPDGTEATLRREIQAEQEIYFPGGGRGRFPVETHVVSVTEPSDVLLKLSTNNVTLKPGGAVEIDVDVIRQKDYKGNVVLDVILRHLGSRYGDPLPPGVTMDENASKTLLGPTDVKGKIVLKAEANAAPLERFPIAVLGSVSINFVVKVSHASEPLYLSIVKP